MKAKLLGALKAVAPFVLSLVYVGVDELFGTPIDSTNVKALILGAITSLAVYLVPNIKSV